MSLTRQRLAELDEDTLRRDVLIPLFEAMGFRGVHLYHGGSLELGKDIIMWKPGEFRERHNYVVVAKAQPIKGNVSGKDSYSEVVRQIHQCFGNTYLDRTTLQDLRADRCIVVTSKDFKKGAQNAIKGELSNTHLDRFIEFIDGDELWRLVDRYMGKRTVWAKLDEVANALDKASPHYRIVLNTSGNKRRISIEPKHPDAAKMQPVSFEAKFLFPQDDEGSKARADLDHHFKTGAPVSIAGKFIADFRIPELLRPYFEPDPKISELRLGPNQSKEKFLISAQICGEDGAEATLSDIELINHQAGHEEIHFANEQQNVPWRFLIIMRRQKNDPAAIAEVGTFGFRTDYSTCNVKQELEGLRFEKVFSQGGKLNIFNQETGILLATAPVPKERPGPPEGWIRLIEMLAFIQNKAQIVLKVPASRVISGEEAAIIAQTAQVLDSGQLFFQVGEMSFDLELDEAQKFIQQNTSGSLMTEESSQISVIFGERIDLGPAEITYPNFAIEPSALEEIRKAISEKRSKIRMRLAFSSNAPCRAIYPKWKAK